MSANDKLAATFGPGRTTPTPTLETRIAEVLKAHTPALDQTACFMGDCYGCNWEGDEEEFAAHVAAALAPVIREAQADLVDALADDLGAIRHGAEVAEVAAHVPGEVGRQACIDAWDSILEEPDEWLREKAREHRGNERDHLQDMLFDAWEIGHEAGHANGYHDYQAQRGLAEPLEHEANPYRSHR